MGLLGDAVKVGTGGLIDPGEGPAAASNAASAQAQALNRAIKLQREMYEQGRQDLAPYRSVGQDALFSLSGMFGLGGRDQAFQDQRAEQIKEQLFERDVSGEGKVRRRRLESLGIMSPNDVFDAAQILEQNPDHPYVQGGGGSIGNMLQELADIQSQRGQSGQAAEPDFSQFYESPGYQFRMDQGTQAIERSNAARGRLDSGASLKDLTQFGQGIASQEFNNYANRLASLAGVGQSATSSGVAQGQNFASQQGNLMGQLGNARASGYVGAFNANPLSANSLMGFGSNLLGGMLAGG